MTRDHPRRIDVNATYQIVHTGVSSVMINSPIQISYPACWLVQIDFSFTIQGLGWNDARVYTPYFVEMEGPPLSVNNNVYVNTINIIDPDDEDDDDEWSVGLGL